MSLVHKAGGGALCPVCGDKVPLKGPPPDAIWECCPDCLAEGYTGAPETICTEHRAERPTEKVNTPIITWKHTIWYDESRGRNKNGGQRWKT